MIPVSACLIVRDEEARLEACLLSIRPYVAEIVVVDTGSQDGTVDIARRHADRVEVYTECNGADGKILSFAQARNRSFELASHDWVFWVDGDDTVEGLSHLQELIAEHIPDGHARQIMLPYHYALDEKGNPVTRHYRERIMYPRRAFEWRKSVHEVAMPKEGWTLGHRISDDITFVHHRDQGPPKPGMSEKDRNLRLLKRDNDQRDLFYLGLEYGNNGDTGNAYKFLNFYVDVDTNHEQRYIALLRIVEHRLREAFDARHSGHGSLELECLRQASNDCWRAIQIQENWPFAYIFMAKVYFHLANHTQDRRDWERVCYWATLGISRPDPLTFVFVNPMEKLFEVHRYLNRAFNMLGQIEAAAESCRAALLVKEDAELRQNLMAYEGHLKPRPDKRWDGEALRISVFVGHSPIGPWDPETAKRDGIGGSETAVIEMSKRWAAAGHYVSVFGHVVKPSPGARRASWTDAYEYDGVAYLDASQYAPHECDVLISSRNAMAFTHGVRAWHNVLWVHDIGVADLTPAIAAKIDRIMVLSEWHKTEVMRLHPFLDESKLTVTRNGIDLVRFAKIRTPANPYDAKRNPHTAIYSSSPDRGLERALKLWPRIRERVPDASLRIYYGFDTWEACAPGDPRITSLKQMIKDTEGAVLVGKTNQQDLAWMFMHSGVWFYPTWFTETSCITAMEAQAAGMAIVTSPLAALNETVGNRGRMCITDDEFVDAVVTSMTMHDEVSRETVRDYAFEHFGWDGVAKEWESLLTGSVVEACSAVPGLPSLPPSGRLSIAFAYGAWCTGDRLFDIDKLWTDPRGLTGSEVSFFSMAREMRLRGHIVDIFCRHKPRNKTLWEGCRVFEIGQLDVKATEGFDAVCVWNEPDLLRRVAPGPVRLVNQQLNDFDYCQPGFDDVVDVYTSPSEGHREHIRKLTPVPTKWEVLANGVDPKQYHDPDQYVYSTEKVPGRVIYASSPDRGLHLLLEVWPTILAAVPHASLRIFYNFAPWFDRMVPLLHCNDAGLAECARRAIRIKELIDQPGVEHLHSISRVQMAKEMSDAQILAYPCDTIRYTEGFSVTLMEACAAGVLPVTSSVDALGGIYGGHVPMVPAPCSEHLDDFARLVIQGLTDEEWRLEVTSKAKLFAEDFRWDRLGWTLERILRDRKGKMLEAAE